MMAVADSTSSYSHLVLLHFTTAGLNGESLGVDEQEIVMMSYMLLDIGSNQIQDSQCLYVRPNNTFYTDDQEESFIQEECRKVTGISEASFKHSKTLEVALNDLDRFIATKGLSPETFCLCTEGQLHLRQVLYPEVTRKNILLKPYMFKFFDVQAEFRKLYNGGNNAGTTNDAAAAGNDEKLTTANMLSYIGFDANTTAPDYGTRCLTDTATILQRLIADGLTLTTPEVINPRLKRGPCLDEFVDDNHVVKARGLPWQATDEDIYRFFRGLNVARGGVALCLSQQGRRNGEALVRFDTVEHRDLAIRRHRHHLGQRYIEVYRASGKEFVDIAGVGKNALAKVFLDRGDGTHVVVRMRGLPFDTSAQQIKDFFTDVEEPMEPVEIMDGENDGILFIKYGDGRATGDAFVMFASDKEAQMALLKNKDTIGTRYIELFRSTSAEVMQVVKRSSEIVKVPSHTTLLNHDLNHNLLTALSMPIMGPGGPQIPILIPTSTGAPGLARSLYPPTLPAMPTSPLYGAATKPPQLFPSSEKKDCIRMRGLPYEARVEHVLEFLGKDLASFILPHGVHMVFSSQGTPSGEAFIQMVNEMAAQKAAEDKNMKNVTVKNKKRYVEVIRCSIDDMNQVLTGLSSSPEPDQNQNYMPSQQMPPPQSYGSIPQPLNIPTALDPYAHMSQGLVSPLSPSAGKNGSVPNIYSPSLYSPATTAAPVFFPPAPAAMPPGHPAYYSPAAAFYGFPQPSAPAVTTAPSMYPPMSPNLVRSNPHQQYSPTPTTPQMIPSNGSVYFYYPSPPMSPATYYAATQQTSQAPTSQVSQPVSGQQLAALPGAAPNVVPVAMASSPDVNEKFLNSGLTNDMQVAYAMPKIN